MALNKKILLAIIVQFALAYLASNAQQPQTREYGGSVPSYPNPNVNIQQPYPIRYPTSGGGPRPGGYVGEPQTVQGGVIRFDGPSGYGPGYGGQSSGSGYRPGGGGYSGGSGYPVGGSSGYHGSHGGVSGGYPGGPGYPGGSGYPGRLPSGGHQIPGGVRYDSLHGESSGFREGGIQTNGDTSRSSTGESNGTGQNGEVNPAINTIPHGPGVSENPRINGQTSYYHQWWSQEGGPNGHFHSDGTSYVDPHYQPNSPGFNHYHPPSNGQPGIAMNNFGPHSPAGPNEFSTGTNFQTHGSSSGSSSTETSSTSQQNPGSERVNEQPTSGSSALGITSSTHRQETSRTTVTVSGTQHSGSSGTSSGTPGTIVEAPAAENRGPSSIEQGRESPVAPISGVNRGGFYNDYHNYPHYHPAPGQFPQGSSGNFDPYWHGQFPPGSGGNIGPYGPSQFPPGSGGNIGSNGPGQFPSSSGSNLGPQGPGSLNQFSGGTRQFGTHTSTGTHEFSSVTEQRGSQTGSTLSTGHPGAQTPSNPRDVSTSTGQVATHTTSGTNRVSTESIIRRNETQGSISSATSSHTGSQPTRNQPLDRPSTGANGLVVFPGSHVDENAPHPGSGQSPDGTRNFGPQPSGGFNEFSQGTSGSASQGSSFHSHTSSSSSSTLSEGSANTESGVFNNAQPLGQPHAGVGGPQGFDDHYHYDPHYHPGFAGYQRGFEGPVWGPGSPSGNPSGPRTFGPTGGFPAGTGNTGPQGFPQGAGFPQASQGTAQQDTGSSHGFTSETHTFGSSNSFNRGSQTSGTSGFSSGTQSAGHSDGITGVTSDNRSGSSNSDGFQSSETSGATSNETNHSQTQGTDSSRTGNEAQSGSDRSSSVETDASETSDVSGQNVPDLGSIGGY